MAAGYMPQNCEWGAPHRKFGNENSNWMKTELEKDRHGREWLLECTCQPVRTHFCRLWEIFLLARGCRLRICQGERRMDGTVRRGNGLLILPTRIQSTFLARSSQYP